MRNFVFVQFQRMVPLNCLFEIYEDASSKQTSLDQCLFILFYGQYKMGSINNLAFCPVDFLSRALFSNTLRNIKLIFFSDKQITEKNYEMPGNELESAGSMCAKATSVPCAMLPPFLKTSL